MKAYKLLTALLFNVALFVLVASVFGLPAAAIFGLFIAVTFFVKVPTGALRMGLDMEEWQRDIVENLFPNNDFAEIAYNADQYVLGGAVVHIPNAGAPLASIRNATQFPIVAVQRGDSDVKYVVDKYFAPSIRVQLTEQATLSYNKRQSVAGEQQKQLIKDAMSGLLYNWGWKTPNDVGTTPGNTILTTGAATSADIIGGATGQRKTLTADVFSAANKAMNVTDVPMEGRYALLTATHYQQFLDSLSDAAKTNFNALADMSKGVVGMYLGFKFMMRSSVQRWRKIAGVWTPVDTLSPGFAASDQTGDSAASLIYQKDCVERAKGAVNVYYNAGMAQDYGDLMSADLRFGGRQRRSVGVYSIIEDLVAA